MVERDSYDTWGRRREPNGNDDPVLTGSITSQTTRGFTDQEELADVSLIHFNGRVYDPLIARFTSADPTVSQPDSSQGWNRYAYVGNNPLAFTDPNGFCFLGCFWKPLFRSPIFVAVVAVAAVVTFNYEVLPAMEGLETGLSVAAISANAAADAGLVALNAGISGGIAGAITGGTWQSALIGVGAGLAFNEIGTLTPGANNFGSEAYFENVAGHAAIGCTVATAAGGSCGSGALAAGFGAAAGPVINTTFKGNLIGGTIASATIGGVGSVLGGGKFENGAVTAAFGYLFNEAVHAAVENGSVVYTNSDGSQDTYSGGSISWRDNNPGNMIAGSGPYQPIGYNGKLSIFPDYNTGYDAMVDDLYTVRYQTQTVAGAIATWAPVCNQAICAGNDPVIYANHVEDWTGIPANTPMNTLSPGQINAVANAIQRQEGWKAGTITHVPPQSQ